MGNNEFITWYFIDDSSSSSSSDSNDSYSDDAVEIFFDNQKSFLRKHKIKNYVEKTVEAYSPDDFFSHFRMSRQLVQILESTLIEAAVLPSHKPGREKVSTRKAILLTIWYLSNQESFRQIADRFNLSLSTCHVVISKVTSHFVATAQQYIKWPDDQRQRIISDALKNKHNIGGIVGTIDGTHIPIKKPLADQEVYVNRKGFHSLLVQATCDHTRLFIDIYSGEPGSLHDARLLKKSPLYRKAVEENFMGNNFLLGDSAYPSLHWLVPPFKDNGNLTNNQKTFNFRHSSTRMIIEHAFGLLKGRFRRLRGFENESITFINKCIMTACVFHNICITKGEMDVEAHLENNVAQDLPEEEIQVNRREAVFAQLFPDN